MTRTPLRLPLAGLEAGDRRLDEAASKYLLRVHRLTQGDPFIAFDPASGLECDGAVGTSQGRSLTITLGKPRATTQRPPQPLLLLQGLPKPARLDTIARASTELGVTELLVCACARSQTRKLSEAQLKRCDRIRADAARQCGRGDMPTLHALPSLQDGIAQLQQHHPNAVRWLLHPAVETQPSAPEPGRALVVAVGPEGGFNDAEVEQLISAGFSPLRLGRHVMRTETAAIAALGVAAYHAAFQPDPLPEP